jgi:hypothetical protein
VAALRSNSLAETGKDDVFRSSESGEFGGLNEFGELNELGGLSELGGLIGNWFGNGWFGNEGRLLPPLLENEGGNELRSLNAGGSVSSLGGASSRRVLSGDGELLEYDATIARGWRFKFVGGSGSGKGISPASESFARTIGAKNSWLSASLRSAEIG